MGTVLRKGSIAIQENGTIGSRNVINSDEVGLVYDRTEDGNLEEQELFNIEADQGKLTEYQKRFNDATDRPTGEFVVRSEERGMRHEDDMSRTRSTSNGAARTSDGRLDGVAYQNLRGLSEAESLSEGPQDNPSGYSNSTKGGVNKNLPGRLREGDLDAHLQARRDAMPKMGIEAARANVQAALNREPGETRKAWAKRKLKATSDFIVEQTSDARLPVIDAMCEITGKTTHSERTDVPLAMQLSYGRVFEQHLNIDQNFVNPTLQILADNGLDIETLDTYLVAMYAPERNKMIKERTAFGNSKGNLSGSGITDEVAAKRIDELRKRLTQRQFDALNRAASRVWELNRSNLDRLAAYGIMSEEQAETWKKLPPHYVPLRDEIPPSIRLYGVAAFFVPFAYFVVSIKTRGRLFPSILCVLWFLKT